MAEPVDAGGDNKKSWLARSFRELETYRYSLDLAQRLFELSKEFPAEERYGLTDQLRRSSRSVGAQIAEGWGKRRYVRSFVTKLVEADGEQMETQHWIAVAVRCGYIERGLGVELVRSCEELGRMIGGMIASAHTFCSPGENKDKTPRIVRERPAIYSVSVAVATTSESDDIEF